MADEQKYTVQLVFAGVRLLNDGKLGHRFYQMDGDDSTFTPKKRMLLNIGDTYEFECVDPDGRSVYMTTAKRVNAPKHPNTDEWRLEDKAHTTAQDSAAAKRRMEREAKEVNKDLGGLTLLEVKMMMSRSAAGRNALTAAVLEYIRPY